MMRPASRRRGAARLREAEVEITGGEQGHERRDLRGVAHQRLSDQLELRLEDEREVCFLIEVVVAAARIDDLASARSAHLFDGGQRRRGGTARAPAAAATVLHRLDGLQVTLQLGLLGREVTECALQRLDL